MDIKEIYRVLDVQTNVVWVETDAGELVGRIMGWDIVIIPFGETIMVSFWYSGKEQSLIRYGNLYNLADEIYFELSNQLRSAMWKRK